MLQETTPDFFSFCFYFDIFLEAYNIISYRT